ncbi:MAG: hypothetical protein ACRBB3_02175 [Alphaproteobacteria bacterium]
MNIIKHALLTFCMLLAFSSTVSAKDGLLTREQVEAFIGSYDVLRPLSEEMKAAGFTSFFKHDPQLMAKKDMPLYTENLRVMKENTPQYYDRFVDIIAEYSHDTGDHSDPEYKFDSAQDWSKTGDQIMFAHFTENSTASKTAYDDLMAAVPPGMMGMLKGEQKKKVQEQLEMMQSAQNVDLADKKLVESLEDGLVNFFIEAR